MYAVLLVLYADWPLFGIQASYLMSMGTLLYLAVVRPFETRQGNNSEIFNELCILACINHLYMYTDYYTDVEKQMESGWSFIAIIGLNIMVNTSMMVYTSALMVKNLVKKLRQKYRVWKYKREL
jgi:hypothetical protein